MSILSDYRNKRKTLRRVYDDMIEVVRAPDISVVVKDKLIDAAHRENVLPGLAAMSLVAIHYELGTIGFEQKIHPYFIALDSAIGRDPHIEQGHD